MRASTVRCNATVRPCFASYGREKRTIGVAVVATDVKDDPLLYERNYLHEEYPGQFFESYLFVISRMEDRAGYPPETSNIQLLRRL